MKYRTNLYFTLLNNLWISSITMGQLDCYTYIWASFSEFMRRPIINNLVYPHPIWWWRVTGQSDLFNYVVFKSSFYFDPIYRFPLVSSLPENPFNLGGGPVNWGFCTCSTGLRQLYDKNWKITKKTTMATFRCTNDYLLNNTGHDINSSSYFSYDAYPY